MPDHNLGLVALGAAKRRHRLGHRVEGQWAFAKDAGLGVPRQVRSHDTEPIPELAHQWPIGMARASCAVKREQRGSATGGHHAKSDAIDRDELFGLIEPRHARHRPRRGDHEACLAIENTVCESAAALR